jgi:hypothetical protein
MFLEVEGKKDDEIFFSLLMLPSNRVSVPTPK